MTTFHTARRTAALVTLAAATLLAGCASGPKIAAASPPKQEARWEGSKDVARAIELLNAGKPQDARKRLIKALKRQPGDRVAASLLRQIDVAPEVLLGKRSFDYVATKTDSMSLLAQRFLDDPMLFYALARYNGIAAPGRLEPGRKLRIPGAAKAEPIRAERPMAPRAAAKPAPHAPATPPRAAAAPPRVAPKPQLRTANPARARQLRAAGLEQLNRGAIDRAVALLQQASQLDPANALIRRDLDRSIRIQRTVRARS
jgi:tetratricopeptide (TPR) repeat protein